MLSHCTLGKGKDIIFLHGWGGSSLSFIGTARRFADFRVTLVDFYGFGGTPEPDTPFDLDTCVEAVAEIIRAYDMSEAVIVAHSFGGRVAVRLAHKYPRYVKKLILIDSAGLKPKRKPDYYVKVLLHKFLVKIGKNGLKGSADYRSLSPVMQRSFVNVVNDYTDKDLKYITAPALLIWGAKDKDTPLYMARRFKRKLKRSELKVFEGVGHYSYLERFNETNALIRSYIEGDG